MAKKAPEPTAEEIKLQTDIFNYLKDNLSISVSNSTNNSYEYETKYVSVTTRVELLLTHPVTKEEVSISVNETSDSFSCKDG